MKSICLITDSYPPEVRSASVAMSELANEFVDLGHSVTVITTQPQYNLAPGLEVSVNTCQREPKVRRVRSAFLHNVGSLRKGIGQIMVTAPISLSGMLNKPAFDAVLIYSPPLPVAPAALAVARVRRAKLIVNVQDLFPQNAIDLGVLKHHLLIRAFRLFESAVYKGADWISVPSEGSLDWLVRRGFTNVGVVPNWFDFSPIARDPARLVLRDLGLPPNFAQVKGRSHRQPQVSFCMGMKIRAVAAYWRRAAAISRCWR